MESSTPSELAAHMVAMPGCEWVVAGDCNADVHDEDAQATFSALHLRLAAASGVVAGAYDIDGLWLSSAFDPDAEAYIYGPSPTKQDHAAFTAVQFPAAQPPVP
eukprot:14714775-Alexandrium_andersonii.AAC.1